MPRKKNEIGWLKEKLVPSLRRLGFQRVDPVHGPLEVGRDIIAADYDRFGLLRYYAIQAKDGDLRGTRETRDLTGIITQANTAFMTPHRDPLTGTDHKIAGVYLVVNGVITEAARKILFSKTGGWFSIVDMSQMDIARLAVRAIPNADRLIRLVALKVELKRNARIVYHLLLQLRKDRSKGANIALPMRGVNTRALERYLEVGYHELDFGDLDQLEGLLEISDFINFIVSKLPLGPMAVEYSSTALKTLQVECEVYVETCRRLRRAIVKLIESPRPAPGDRLERMMAKTSDPKTKEDSK